MSLPDWRSAAEYEELRSLDAPGFAWEFLRRNKVFAAERARLADAAARRALDAEEADDFARRWGVRFRGRGRGHAGGRAVTERGGGAASAAASEQSGTPAWARRMQRAQSIRGGASAVHQAIRSGDHPSSGGGIDLSEGE